MNDKSSSGGKERGCGGLQWGIASDYLPWTPKPNCHAMVGSIDISGGVRRACCVHTAHKQSQIKKPCFRVVAFSSQTHAVHK